MAVGNLTRTTHSVFAPELWAAEILEELRNAPPITKYLSTDVDMKAPAGYGDVISVRRPGAVTIGDKAAGTAFSSQYPAPTKVTVTLNKHKGAYTLFEDAARLAIGDKVAQDFIKDAANGIREQINTDILASVWTNLANTNYVGSGGGAGIDSDDVAIAQSTLSTRKVPDADRVLILHPTDMRLLHRDTALSSYIAFSGPDAIRQGKIPELYGFVLVPCPQVATNCTYPVANTRANVAMHKRGQLFASRPIAEPPPNSGASGYSIEDPESGVVINVAMQYQLPGRGLGIVVDCIYGIAELSEDRCIIVAG